MRLKEQLNRKWYQRSYENIIYRKGTRKRHFLITYMFGEITNFEIPRFRNTIFKSNLKNAFSNTFLQI